MLILRVENTVGMYSLGYLPLIIRDTSVDETLEEETTNNTLAEPEPEIEKIEEIEEIKEEEEEEEELNV